MTTTNDIKINGGLRTDNLRIELPDGRYVHVSPTGRIDVFENHNRLNGYRLDLPTVGHVAVTCGSRCLKDDDPGVPVVAYHRP